MYPNLFGLEGFSMTFMIILGIIASTVIVFLYLKKEKLEKNAYLDLLVVIAATAFMGIVFAILFENTYEAIKHAIYNEPQKWTFGMTFYGGLVGGVITFLLMYRFYYLRHNPPIIKKMLIIAPGALAAGHAFGRLGCFLSGCCYGLPTDAWYGIQFVTTDTKVIPTQLFEMIFLIALSVILTVIAFKSLTYQTFPIYMVFYGIFRFIIEFLRGDERGQLPGLSPSQYWSIILFIGGIVFYFILKKYIFKQEGDATNEI